MPRDVSGDDARPARNHDDGLDLLIVGAGPTGLACAIEAAKAGLRAVVVEKGCVVNSIFHYPANMVFFTTSELLEIGAIPFPTALPKPNRLEALAYYRKVAAHFALDLRLYERVEAITPLRPGFEVRTLRADGAAARYRATAVVIATGYYDLPNLMGVPGEALPHVRHYFEEAHAFAGLEVAVIGGKNFAVETALDLYRHGARVTLIHRQPGLAPSIKYWVRPDIDNRLKAGEIRARFNTRVLEILPGRLRLDTPDGAAEIRADFVFALTGYHPDFDFLRAAGVELDANLRPVCDPASYETNLPGLYLGGVVVAGRNTSEIFIENGRFHGQVIVAHILSQRAAAQLGLSAAMDTSTETILVIETSLDDCSPQVVGYVLERALELGALDAYAVPAQMKKQRPGLVLTLLARPAQRQALVELLLAETTTLGVRIAPCERVVLPRRLERVDTAYGPIAVKIAGGKLAPEYDDCRAAARRHDVPISEVMEAARAAARAGQREMS